MSQIGRAFRPTACILPHFRAFQPIVLPFAPLFEKSSL